jgi:hypothetical protein
MQSVAGGVARDKNQDEGSERNTVVGEFSNDALNYLKKQVKDSRVNNGTTAKVVNPEFNDYDVLT